MRIAATAIVPVLVAGLLIASAPARSEEAVPASPGLDQLDCRSLLRLGGEERAYTLLYYHGFVSGRRNQLQLATDTMAEATDRVIDRCIERPGDKVLKVFEEARPAG